MILSVGQALRESHLRDSASLTTECVNGNVRWTSSFIPHAFPQLSHAWPGQLDSGTPNVGFLALGTTESKAPTLRGHSVPSDCNCSILPRSESLWSLSLSNYQICGYYLLSANPVQHPKRELQQQYPRPGSGRAERFHFGLHSSDILAKGPVLTSPRWDRLAG